MADIGSATITQYFASYPSSDPFYYIYFWGEESYSADSDTFLMFKWLFDDTELLANHSYTFSFDFCLTSDFKVVNPVLSTDEEVLNHMEFFFKNSDLSVSILVAFGEAVFGETEENVLHLFDVNLDNYSEFVGKTVSTSFAVSNFVGVPRVMLMFSGSNRYVLDMTFGDFALYDNDNTASELKGIKGLLHSLYWDLFGGVCDDEDCPHSSDDNPHADLLTRLFVPDEESVTSWKDKLDKLLADHLGIIYDAVDFMGSLIATVRDVLSNPSGDITFPGIDFDLPGGQHVHLFDETVVDFTFLESGFFKVFYSMYKLMLNVICIFALTKYAMRLWDKTMSN